MSARRRKPRTIAAIAGKGGVGKSTLCAALGAIGAARGWTVALLDADPSGGLSYAVGVSPAQITGARGGLHAALRGDFRTSIDELLLPTPDGGRLLSANATLLADELDATAKLPLVIAQLHAIADLVVVDAPPGFGGLTQAAAVVASEIVVPLVLEPLALNTIALVTGMLLGRQIERRRIAGFVPMMASMRLQLAADQLEELRELADGIPILEPVPRAVAVAVAALSGRSVVTFAPSSPASIALELVADALKL